MLSIPASVALIALILVAAVSFCVLLIAVAFEIEEFGFAGAVRKLIRR